MGKYLLIVLFSLSTGIVFGQTFNLADLITLHDVAATGVDSLMKTKKFEVCEEGGNSATEEYSYTKYSANCKEEFMEYMTDYQKPGHRITYVFYDNATYAKIQRELNDAGFRRMNRSTLATCRTTDYYKNETYQFQLRVCKQEEGPKYYLSMPIHAQENMIMAKE